MSELPLVRVITPTYNHRRFIARCIESVLAQTDPRWEQVVVDDGSDDGTADIVAAVADPRVRLVRMPHRGVAYLGDTYAAAVRGATTPFVAVLEGDDFWPATKLERQLRAFQHPEVVLSWGRAGEVTPEQEVHRSFPSTRFVRAQIGCDERARMLELIEHNYIPACTVVLRRDALERIGGFSQPAGVPFVDYPTWLRISSQGTIAPIDELLGFWQRHPFQVTTIMAQEVRQSDSLGSRYWWGLRPDQRRAAGISDGEVRRAEGRRRGTAALGAALAQRGHRDKTASLRYCRTALRVGRRGDKLRATAIACVVALGIDPMPLFALRGRARTFSRNARRLTSIRPPGLE